jgi:hypothetical protein
MLFATYYEMQEWEALHALAESFKVFIHRRKNIIPEGRRNSYLNLIKYTRHSSTDFTNSVESSLMTPSRSIMTSLERPAIGSSP